MTRVLHVDRDHPDPSVVEEAARVIHAGGLVAFPTETVYGLAADATSDAAVARIYQAKGRPSNNPLIAHAADFEMALRCHAVWTPEADRLANACWPGPLTIVLPKSKFVSETVAAGLSSVGVRIPRPAVSRALIEAVGRPLAAPSANRSSGISPTEAKHVLKDLAGRIDLVLDAGSCAVGIESTVVDLTNRPARLLRPGGVSLAEIEALIGPVDVAPLLDPDHRHASPGRLAVHYAPKTSTWLVASGLIGPQLGLERSAALLFSTTPAPADGFGRVVLLADPHEAAERLYAMLHELDEQGWEALYLFEPPETEAWRAVLDRIRRAGRPLI